MRHAEGRVVTCATMCLPALDHAIKAGEEGGWMHKHAEEGPKAPNGGPKAKEWASPFLQENRAPQNKHYAPIQLGDFSTMNLQTHHAARAGKHTDLRLRSKDDDRLYSFALPKGLPTQGDSKPRLAIRQEDHNPHYEGFEGEVKTPHGVGTVTSDLLSQVRILSHSPGHIRLRHEDNEYLLHRTRSTKNWLMRAIPPTASTPSTKKPAQPAVPSSSLLPSLSPFSRTP